MRRASILIWLGVTSALSGCASSTGPTTSATPPAVSSPAATAAPSVDIPPNAIRITLSLPEAAIPQFQIDGQPVREIRVRADVPYLFEVANLGRYDHNFFIGVAEDLAAQEYDRLTGTHLWSAGIRQVVYTFKPGQTVQFACTLAGHYGPMHGDFLLDG